jgi:hypothetical protein
VIRAEIFGALPAVADVEVELGVAELSVLAPGADVALVGADTVLLEVDAVLLGVDAVLLAAGLSVEGVVLTLRLESAGEADASVELRLVPVAPEVDP